MKNQHPNFKIFLFFVFLLPSFAFSQDRTPFWIEVSENQISQEKLASNSEPNESIYYQLDIETLKRELNEATLIQDNFGMSKATIGFPDSNGKIEQYRVKEASVLNPNLQNEFQNIRSYIGISVSNPLSTLRFSVSPDGFHAMKFDEKTGIQFIDPITKDRKIYSVFAKNDLMEPSEMFSCHVEENFDVIEDRESLLDLDSRLNDGNLRTFRLAIACTNEYANFHLTEQGIDSGESDTVKKEAVLAAMNTTMTRVNGIYEKELSVRMEIIAENLDIIFLDDVTDPFTGNDDASVLIDESQTQIDLIIGNDNYDIGHTFSTGAGGVATLSSPCRTNLKARGVTGLSAPIGDSYNVDYVAHEMGHQFGANHTFNNSCGGNRNNATAVEPGSGSTIMAYAGICAPNVQGNSDAYFHIVSLEEMWANINTGFSTCGATTSSGNSAPVVEDIPNYSIPRSTPFVLKGNGQDADGNGTLTYAWEQTDNETAAMPPVSSSTGGPVFRSITPSDMTDRYFPAIETVIAGDIESTWEVVPSVERTMNFALTVRDNDPRGGRFVREDITINVENVLPFAMTAPNTAVTWEAGTNETVSWGVGSTTNATINCQNVNIKLSTDGGLTFPITILENTPNDGTQSIVVPNYTSSTCRIMVEAADNIFYDISNADFTINSTIPSFIITNTNGNQTECNTSGSSVTFEFDFDAINGFNESTTFNTSGEPAGSTVEFSPTTQNGDGTFTMEVSDFVGAAAGEYSITVTATSASITQTTDVILTIISGSLSTVNLLSPIDEETEVSIIPTLTWTEDLNAQTYDIEIATDTEFSNIVQSLTSEENSYTLTTPLEGLSTFYWRVRPANTCGTSAPFSSPFSFTTLSPSYCPSTYTNAGSEYISNVSFADINNASGDAPGGGTTTGYENFTSVSTDVNEGSTYTLEVTINTAGDFSDHCNVYIDWNQDYVFNQDDEFYDLGSIRNVTSGVLSTDITVPSGVISGPTRMRVSIEFQVPPGACDEDHTQEWGETEDYSINVVSSLSVDEQQLSDFRIYPNPSNGLVNVSMQLGNSNDVEILLFDVLGRQISIKNFENNSLNFNEQLEYQNLSKGLYVLKIKQGQKIIAKQLIIN
ncbi:reprolysin-like metallopeptidase [Urechidicola croceus]|uniref:Uncharacterized protein n=1 Tax=Urechidicola croceus TaxID=1850246 RepID=A0A1D8P8M4_9FLAO|nr:zinc-dependent metalloprotease family protein [Urechidicola croceus]AOW20937.1 hypothetical protein LPB138_09745 [Urechidicola croceus]